MAIEELAEVERLVNQRIHEGLSLVEARSVAMEKAIAEGAMALFGEKYGDTVRTIRFGESIELCGGTHVNNTSEIWQFKIVSEEELQQVSDVLKQSLQKGFENITAKEKHLFSSSQIDFQKRKI